MAQDYSYELKGIAITDALSDMPAINLVQWRFGKERKDMVAMGKWKRTNSFSSGHGG